MKKLFTTMVLLLALLIVGKAQAPLLSEGFEDGIPTTWTTVNADGDNYDWTAGTNDNDPADAHTGEGYVYSRSWSSSSGALTPDNWLITPTINIPSNGNYDLTFWVSAMQDDYPQEHYSVWISTSNNPEDLNSYVQLYEQTLQATHGGSPAQSQGYWENVTIHLNNYSGNVHIAFRHHACTDLVAICLDDIMVDLSSTEPKLNVNATEILFGSGTVGNAFGVQQFSVTGMNLSSNVTLTIPTGTPFGISTDTVFGNTITLTPNAAGNVNGTINVNFAPTAANLYTSTITVTSQLGTHTIHLEGFAVDCSQSQTIPWYETFTSQDFPDNCWSMTFTDTAGYRYENEDGTITLYPNVKRYTWWHSASSQYASVVGDDEGVQDEHLYTPIFNLSNATGAADFQFDFRTNPKVQSLIDGDVRFTVNMSTDGGNTYTTVWDVQDIRAEWANTWSSWSDVWPVRINMDQYLGTNAQIKFDFHYESEETAADQAIIQAVKFTSYQDPRMAVTADDTLSFFSYVGAPEVFTLPVEGRNLSTAINVTTTAPFEVSIDGTTYATTATLPLNGGNLYVRYNPTTTTSSNANLTVTTTYTDANHVYGDTVITHNIVLLGNSYDCAVITLPITESFESESVFAYNTTEYCWETVKGNPNDAQNDMVNSTENKYIGTRSFRFSSTKSNTQQVYDQYLISPELSANAPITVMFNYANSSVASDEVFRVGFSSTGKEIGDFTWGDDIENIANTEWQLYRNINVPANTKYVAVNYKSNHKAYLYIDNFQIMVTPTCPAPVNVAAVSTGVDCANITWAAGNTETDWEMVYGIAPLDLASATPTSLNQIGTTLNNLTANTHYQIALRAVCGMNNTSEWSEIANFWTTTTPATIPYTQTFEDNDADRGNWVLVNNNEPNYFMFGNIPASTTGKAMMITNNGSSNTYLTTVGDNLISHYSTVWAYRDIQFPQTTATAFLMSFNWKCYAEPDYDFGELYIGNATEVPNFERNENIPGFVDVNTDHYAPAGLTCLGRFVGEATMQTASYLIPAENVAGTVKRIYFLWTNDSLSGDETPLAIDNFSITIPEFANLTGTVANEQNQNPIVGATIIAKNLDNGISYTTTTDNTGAFSLPNVTMGFYEITARANGYQSSTISVPVMFDYNVSILLSIEPCTILPTNVSAYADDDNLVMSWDPIEGGTISQATGSNFASAIGGPSAFGCYHLFTPEQLTSVNGATINSVSLGLNEEPGAVSFTLRIFIGGTPTSGPASNVPVYEQAITADQYVDNGWSEIVLNEPYVIDGSQCLWIGYHITDASGTYPAGVTDNNASYNGYGNVMVSGSTWTTLLAVASSLNYNWMIRAEVAAPNLTYNILEDGEIIASNITGNEYIVSPFDPSSCYQVVTVCENGVASEPSGCSTVGVNSVDNAASFEVYPNPAHETVTVSTSMNAQKVEVLNYLGQVIYSQNVSGNIFTLNVANYADGVYFIRLTGNDSIATQKLIKK